MLKKIMVLMLLVCTSTVSAQEDWVKSFWQDGCVRNFERDYESAINLASRQAASYQTTCNAQGGSFSWTYKKGFCSPEDPNDLACRHYCTVHATVSCKMPAVRGQLDISSPETAVVPGAKINAFLNLTNLKSQTIRGATAEVSVASGQTVALLSNGNLAWDDLAPGASLASTSTLNLSIHDAAACGSGFSLRFLFDTPPYGRQETTKAYSLGRFTGVPTEVRQDNLSTKIDGEGVTLELPVSFESDTPLAGPRKVSFTFTAKVNNNSNTYVRFTLVSPDRKVSRIISEGYANGRFVYDQDLTDAFKGVPLAGSWTFIAKSWGAGVLENYRLVGLPNAYTCH